VLGLGYHRYAGVMLGSLSWDRLLILLAAALVVLGPERLPGAVRSLTRTLRQVREQVNRAADQTRAEVGPDLAEVREPLAALAELRSDLRDFTTTNLLEKPEPQPVPPASARSMTHDAGRSSSPPIDPEAT
jgi:sec-independent protein translocase protein TatB